MAKAKTKKFAVLLSVFVITLPVITFLFTPSVSAKDISLDIITRAEWEADESWRFNSKNQEIWPAEYAKVEKIIIHHTAGSLGGADPAAIIRGIYHWHAVSLGWGDIGYNYLIDEKGNVYEGRYGGDGVMGAHAYNDKTNAGYNRGTLGIAILGNYQTDVLTNAAKEALTNLIAVKARDFGFAPDGRSIFNDEDLLNLVAHRDIDSTLCPGRNIYSQMDQIRESSQIKYKGLPGLPAADKEMTYVGQSDATLTLSPGEEKEMWVDYRNDGRSTWKNYVASTPYLSVTETSPLKASDWLSDTQAAGLSTPNVASGQTGRFVFKIKAPNDEIRLDQSFRIIWDEEAVPGTSFNLHLEITGFDYAANDLKHDILKATFPKVTRTVTINYQNIGLKTWAKDDIYLAITNENGRQSSYYDAAWPDQGGKIRFNESEVKSQGRATFTFKMHSQGVDAYKTKFSLKKSDGTTLPGSEKIVATRVDSTYQGKIVSQTVPVALLSSWRPTVTVKFENTGLSTWGKNIVLNVYDGDWRNSAFSHQSWPTAWGHFNFQETQVRPGETATFRLTLYPPARAGTYFTIFKLENTTSVSLPVQGETRLLIRVDDAGLKLAESYQAEFLSVSAPPALRQYQRFTNVVKIKNTGTQTWGKDVVLNIYDADWRETYFRDELTWPAFEGGITFLEDQVRPGETATFRFIYRAPVKTGLYRNRFMLSIAGREYLGVPGSENSALTRVDPI
ncbi:MAG: peptidoglycan recognition family protein [Patescibacteria group bacterium]